MPRSRWQLLPKACTRSDFAVKLLNFFSDPLFNSLRTEMKAPLVAAFAPQQITLLDAHALRRLGTEGIDVEDFDEIRIEDDGTLSYRGKRVTVYIRDVSQIHGRAKMPRFHFAFCKTLQEMRKNNRWNKYVVANREDGIFIVNVVCGQVESQALPLSVCQNCLVNIGWKGFRWEWNKSTRGQSVADFRLADFFVEYPKDLISSVPRFTADVAPINDYSLDWAEVSERVKADRRYRCEGCGRELTGALKKYLHVHHADGQKFNNAPENLVVLCIRCHAEMPFHSHMKHLEAHSEFLKLFGAPSIPLE